MISESPVGRVGGLAANVWTASRVSGWFGGNETAPRTISYYLKFTR